MTARLEAILVAALALASALPARAVVLTGAVQSDGAQAVYVPPSNSSPVVLRYYLPDGSEVKKGDVLLRIDAGSAASQLRDLKDQIEAAKAKAAQDVADLKLKEIDAELALVDAIAKRETAAVDAALPKKLLSALDYDQYQGALESAKHDADLKQRDLAAAKAAVARARKDGALQVKKLTEQLAYNQTQVDSATVRATMAGVLVHGFETVSFGDAPAGRYEQGSSVFAGSEVGQVVAPGAYSVRAWALASDRQALKVGQKVRLTFDALPGRAAGGTIRSISAAPAEKSEWGDGRYYTIDIKVDGDAGKLALIPGMSVRVDSDPADTATTVAPQAATTLHVSGEIYPKRSVVIAPPTVQGLWMMNVTRMAPDASMVTKGQPIVVFAGGDLMAKLPAEQSKLKEKQRADEKLKLELADRKRTTELATAQAKADAEKAARKANQPQAYVPGVEYKKLVIDRQRTAKRLALTEQRQRVDAQARAASQHAADVAVTQLQRNVADMQASIAKLTVRAPRAGLFVHRNTWDGGTIDVGARVFRGQSVGEIPDMKSLAVRASLPERDLQRVHVGQAVSVVLTGGASSTVPGTIESIGDSVHSKSRVEPVPVVDLTIAIKPGSVKLKPGQPVRVDIAVGKGASDAATTAARAGGDRGDQA